MDLCDFERDELATLPWTVDTEDVRDLDPAFSAFVQHASTQAGDPTFYVTKAAHFEALVPATLHDTDAWVIWLPHLPAAEIGALGKQMPAVIYRREVNLRPLDVCLAWQGALSCFTVFEESVLPSIRRAYDGGYITVIVANTERVAVRALLIDSEFVRELALCGSQLRLDATSPDYDREGRLVMALKPKTYRPKSR